jgi:hypothetical protein
MDSTNCVRKRGKENARAEREECIIKRAVLHLFIHCAFPALFLTLQCPMSSTFEMARNEMARQGSKHSNVIFIILSC